MFGFESVEELPCWLDISPYCVLKTLADSFFGVGARSQIEQTLIGFGVRSHRRWLAITQ